MTSCPAASCLASRPIASLAISASSSSPGALLRAFQRRIAGAKEVEAFQGEVEKRLRDLPWAKIVNVQVGTAKPPQVRPMPQMPRWDFGNGHLRSSESPYQFGCVFRAHKMAVNHDRRGFSPFNPFEFLARSLDGVKNIIAVSSCPLIAPSSKKDFADR